MRPRPEFYTPFPLGALGAEFQPPIRPPLVSARNPEPFSGALVQPPTTGPPMSVHAPPAGGPQPNWWDRNKRTVGMLGIAAAGGLAQNRQAPLQAGPVRVSGAPGAPRAAARRLGGFSSGALGRRPRWTPGSLLGL